MRGEELARISALNEAAAPGPWFVRRLDDDMCMGAVAVSTHIDTGANECMRFGTWPSTEIVVACLIQDPPYVLPESRWDENAALIAATRNALPGLLSLAGFDAQSDRGDIISSDTISHQDLMKLGELDRAASAGPWFVRQLNDKACMSAVAVSIRPDGDELFNDEWCGEEIIAACLIQDPPYVLPEARWDENAALIAAMRNALPELLRLAKRGLANDKGQ